MPGSSKRRKTNSGPMKVPVLSKNTISSEGSTDVIKSAEHVALASFASGLKLAAAFGTVAAKTTSLALASMATGADKFAELVKKEALSSSKSRLPAHSTSNGKIRRVRPKRSKRK